MIELKEFFKNDRYAVLSGIELVEVNPGKALAKMIVEEKHLNAGNVVQGGAIFTLADLAFAAAVNAYGNLAFSIETSIRYFQSVKSGILYAEARVLYLHRKLATCEVTVTNQDKELIALFTATAYRKDVLK
ncbi:MAG: PaaI family thioesterase [Dysgonamonadaceae bacterium]|jgi:acyl-CoA thioesterase|nr:PaaI family thioesterase [Dysgonamonadaceae bacterium]